MKRHAVTIASVLLSATVLSACGSGSTTTTTTLRANQQSSRHHVPWSQLGARWSLAVWNANKAVNEWQSQKTSGNVAHPTRTLFLVTPTGGRYSIADLTHTSATLVDWSPRSDRALLENIPSCPATGACPVLPQAILTTMNMRTAKTTSTFVFPASQTVFLQSLAFSKPRGQALLIDTQTNDHQQLTRYSLSGAVQQVYPTNFSSVGKYAGSQLSSPDGKTLILGAEHGVALVSNAGDVRTQYVVGTTMTECSPTRWWNATTVLASCIPATGLQQLFLISTTDGQVTMLTKPPRSPDNGDMNAWQLSSGVYLQTAGGCGAVYLSVLGPNHYTTPVTVPQVSDSSSTFVLGATSHELLLHATLSCGPGKSLVWFNPRTNKIRVVLGPPLNGGSVEEALAYPTSPQ